jgi:hypothetical protein
MGCNRQINESKERNKKLMSEREILPLEEENSEIRKIQHLGFNRPSLDSLAGR